MVKRFARAFVVVSLATTFGADAIHPVGDYRCVVQRATSIAVVEDKKTDRLVLQDEMGPVVVTELVVRKKFRDSSGVDYGAGEELSMIVRRNTWGETGDKLSRSKLNLVMLEVGEQGPRTAERGAGVLPYDNGVEIGGVKLNDAALQRFIAKTTAVDCPLRL